jgi:hypothetical protein
MFIEGFEAEGLLEAGGGDAAAGLKGPTAHDDFDALDTLMAGAKTRRAGRGKDGQG